MIVFIELYKTPIGKLWMPMPHDILNMGLPAHH
jgi:hypothetical protein